MDVINQFLHEDMLIIRPSVFIYIEKNKKDKVSNGGIFLGDGRINAYLTRLPEDSYQEYLSTHCPIRITLSKLKKIRNQQVKVYPKNMDELGKLDINDDNVLDKMIKRYGEYLNTCYKDRIPLENLPHIELHFTDSFIPGFVCKVLDT